MLWPKVYPIVDTGALERAGFAPREFARVLLTAGVGILQYRHKGGFTAERVEEARAIGEQCRAAGATFVLNDRPDLARLLGAGCHVGQDDLSPAETRAILGPALLGFSTHSEAQLLAEETAPADYLALGPIFATASKANPDPVVGLAALRRLRGLTAKPLIAIGGITLEHARAIWEAGADSIALISALIPASGRLDDVGATFQAWKEASL